MIRQLLPLSLALLTACVTKGSYEATLVDGLEGTPRAEVTVVLEATSTDDLTCKSFSGTTDAAGTVKIEGTCPDTTYNVVVKDDSLVVVGADTVDGGVVSTGAVELKAWRAPKGAGVYVLADDTAKRVGTRTRLMREEKIKGTEVDAVYPESTFKNPTPLAAGQHLVLVGAATIDNTRFSPIVPEPEQRTFESGASLANHAFVGIKFTSDTEYTVVESVLDESKLIEAGDGERRVRYIPHDALPAGQYAVHKEGSADAFVVTFGGAAASPATAKADAPAE